MEARGDRIRKPRTLLWEWLLLGRDSPLRKLLAEKARSSGPGEDTFGFLPSLQFWLDRGEVARLELAPLRAGSAVARRELAVVVGRSLALWSWLGASDLHWENLALGVDTGGRIVFGPLDVELLLGDLARPTETKLLPDADPEYAEICRHAAGVRRVLPHLGKPVGAGELLAMAGAYLATLAFLEHQAPEIARLLARIPGIDDTPIRVLLRGTGEYLHTEGLWPPLLDAEREQLDRGDVPYFFRLLGRPGIHYYVEPSLTRLGRLPLRGDVPRLDPILRPDRGLRSPSRRRLREEGLFTLLGAFDDASLTGVHQTSELAVRFGARDLVVTFPDGAELRSRRNLRAFVGSVYLPCHCGEVSSVLVPRATRCDAG